MTQQIAAYVRQDARGPVLADWHGRTILACRSVAGRPLRLRHGDEMQPIAFLLPGGRAIVGGSLGDGMLYRGELATVADVGDARALATAVAEYWADVDSDAEDAEPDPDAPEVCTCGAELYRDCQGSPRCEHCDEPCPCCHDGGGPI